MSSLQYNSVYERDYYQERTCIKVYSSNFLIKTLDQDTDQRVSGCNQPVRMIRNPIVLCNKNVLQINLFSKHRPTLVSSTQWSGIHLISATERALTHPADFDIVDEPADTQSRPNNSSGLILASQTWRRSQCRDTIMLYSVASGRITRDSLSTITLG